MIGACDAVNPVLDTDYQPTPAECHGIMAWVACSFLLDQTTASALKRMSQTDRVGFTLDVLETLMWLYHDDHASPAERGILSSLYYELPPMGEQVIPF
jgi:hypothetical protein